MLMLRYELGTGLEVWAAVEVVKIRTAKMANVYLEWKTE
jgi:hypothetical protein